MVDEDLAAELNGFLKQWLQNIQVQGHIPYKAYYSSEVLADMGNVSFDKNGNEVAPDLDEDDDMEM